MWNQKPASEYIHMHYLTKQQLMHLDVLDNCKPQVKNDRPWTPQHNLSKNDNKYTKNRNMKVYLDNKNLLGKMMEIEQHQPKKFVIPKTYSMQEYNWKRNNILIHKENVSMLTRLEDQNSKYCSSRLETDFQKHKQYQKNIKKKQIMINVDYTKLALQLRKKKEEKENKANSFKITKKLTFNKNDSQHQPIFNSNENMKLLLNSFKQEGNQNKSQISLQQNQIQNKRNSKFSDVNQKQDVSKKGSVHFQDFLKGQITRVKMNQNYLKRQSSIESSQNSPISTNYSNKMQSQQFSPSKRGSQLLSEQRYMRTNLKSAQNDKIFSKFKLNKQLSQQV